MIAVHSPGFDATASGPGGAVDIDDTGNFCVTGDLDAPDELDPGAGRSNSSGLDKGVGPQRR